MALLLTIISSVSINFLTFTCGHADDWDENSSPWFALSSGLNENLQNRLASLQYGQFAQNSRGSNSKTFAEMTSTKIVLTAEWKWSSSYGDLKSRKFFLTIYAEDWSTFVVFFDFWKSASQQQKNEPKMTKIEVTFLKWQQFQNLAQTFQTYFRNSFTKLCPCSW